MVGAEDADQEMSAQKAGPAVTTSPDGPPTVVPASPGSSSDPVAGPPPGTTRDGVDRWHRIIGEGTEEHERQLRHELARRWLGQNVTDGPEVHTWNDVQQAERTRQEAERQRILDAERIRMRTEIVEEMQLSERMRNERAKRNNVWWLAGSCVTAGGSMTAAVMALPGTSLLVRIALVGAAVIGAAITRPRG